VKLSSTVLLVLVLVSVVVVVLAVAAVVLLAEEGCFTRWKSFVNKLMAVHAS